jgi:hypothetical protein
MQVDGFSGVSEVPECVIFVHILSTKRLKSSAKIVCLLLLLAAAAPPPPADTLYQRAILSKITRSTFVETTARNANLHQKDGHKTCSLLLAAAGYSTSRKSRPSLTMKPRVVG